MSARDIPALLRQALALQQQGQYDAAEALYWQVLQSDREHFDALHLLGVLARQRGDASLAVTRLRAAIAVHPQQAIAHGNLGAALQDLGQSEEALASYERALDLQPGYAMAWNNRGNALRSLGKLTAALHSYDQALLAKADYPEALLNRGISLQAMGQHEQALDDFEEALQLKPNDAAIHFALAVSLQFMGHYEAAITGYEHVLRLQATHAQASCNLGMCLQKLQHYDAALVSLELALHNQPDLYRAHLHRAQVLRQLDRTDAAIIAYHTATRYCEHTKEREHIEYALAALGRNPVPAIAPASYVIDLFDQYAGHFDSHLLGVLAYRVPALLAAAIARHRTGPACTSLDLGCGTGLCAPHLRPYSSHLSGVDLSEKMLEKARKTGLYDDLHCADIVSYLQNLQPGLGLIVAADVFVYIGDLASVFAASSRVLESGAYFAFSAEISPDADYLLGKSQRYAHSYAYLQRLAGQYGFVITEARQESARQDQGADTPIHIILMQRQ